jgi:hypothetical protein
MDGTSVLGVEIIRVSLTSKEFLETVTGEL